MESDEESNGFEMELNDNANKAIVLNKLKKLINNFFKENLPLKYISLTFKYIFF